MQALLVTRVLQAVPVFRSSCIDLRFEAYVKFLILSPIQTKRAAVKEAVLRDHVKGNCVVVLFND